MLALAVAVGLSSLAIGAILSTALLIGPAATALRLTRADRRRHRRGRAARRRRHLARHPPRLRQLLLGLRRSHGCPVSFFIVALVFLFYLASRPPRRWRGTGAHHRADGPDRR